MEPWFVESKALSVSCNYELVCWAAVWLNHTQQVLEEQEAREAAAGGGAAAAAAAPPPPGAEALPGPPAPLLPGPPDLLSPVLSPVVPHTYTTPWHEFLVTQLEGARPGETAMDVDSDVDEG